MTRKHFIKVADLLAELIYGGGLCFDNEKDVSVIVERFMQMLGDTNYRFDRARFLAHINKRVDELNKEWKERC